jgi:hypothetical protein
VPQEVAERHRLPLGDKLALAVGQKLTVAEPDCVSGCEGQEGVTDDDSDVVKDSQEAVADVESVPLSVGV